jgi:hypothetical protein
MELLAGLFVDFIVKPDVMEFVTPGIAELPASYLAL